MPRRQTLLTRIAAGLGVLLGAVAIAAAQSFTPVAQVNDEVVTAWELQQRQRMLAVLRAPPEVQASALDSLINERLQLQAAAAVGATVSERAIEAGINDFASRGNLSADRFLELIAQEGVDRATIRDFVRAGLAWRNAVRARFRGEVDIGDDEIARAREAVTTEAGPRVLLTEIVLPARNQIEEADARTLAEELSRIGSTAAFSDAAVRHSVADSAAEAGRVGWIPLRDLQGPVANALSGLAPGQVAGPISVPDGLALYQVRARDDGPASPGAQLVDYAQLLIPGGRSAAALKQAAEIDARADTCDDLYGVGEGRIVREERPLAEVPADIRAELDRLDRNEVSTGLVRGDALVFLMLCERDVGGTLAIADAALSNRLESEELAGRAALWLAELRSEAFIRIGGE